MAGTPAILNAEEIGQKLSESFRVLAKLQGFSERTVVLAEVGVVLKTCVLRTKVAKPDIIAIRVRHQVLRGLDLTQSTGPESVTINTGQRGFAGRVWWRTKNDRFQLAGQLSDDAQTFTPSRYHFKKGNWIDIQEAAQDAAIGVKRALPLALGSANLARQSWVQMADDLGLILEDIPGGASGAAIAKARRAIASNGRTYRNGIGTEQYEQNKSYLATLTNQLPYWPKINLDTILAAVLAGRAKFFEQNVQREVFASHANTVRAYPWLKLVGAEL